MSKIYQSVNYNWNQNQFSYNDIILYDSENHKIYLNNNFSNYLGKDSTRVFSKIFGVPFVLVANGGRIYLGSFVTGISSWLPKIPKIVDYSVNRWKIFYNFWSSNIWWKYFCWY